MLDVLMRFTRFSHFIESNEFFVVVVFQQREEKQLEASMDSLISLVDHVKNALQSFIYKLENEYERLTW